MTRDRLKQLAEDKDELLGILAHDLKSHLGGMQMSASVLRNRIAQLSEQKRAQLCENIYHSTGQLLAFVKEFLANSAADHGFELRTEIVDIAGIVTRVAQDYDEAALRKSLKIHCEIPLEPLNALADHTATTQVFDNLVSNAVKFSPPNREIHLVLRATSDHIECRVRDQGPGFSEEDKARMFRRYGRLSARPTGGEPSTGLGLSIVKKLVQAMKGDLTCDSAPDQGATFTVRLPRSNSN
jgi:two-component system sensor histidine kinase/response regulator